MNNYLISKILIASIFSILIISCQKESLDTMELVSENSDTATASKRNFSCDLASVSTSNYAILATKLAGVIPTSMGILDEYFECINGVAEEGDDCCPTQTIYLLGPSSGTIEFESWGPQFGQGGSPSGYQYNYLNNGVCSVAEQNAFIDRILSEAIASTPVCSNGGIYSPVAYNISWSPVVNIFGTPGVAMHVQVTYTSTCLSFCC